MVSRRVRHLNDQGLGLETLLVMRLLGACLIDKILLLRAVSYLIYELLLRGRKFDYLMVVLVQPMKVILVLFK